jgi:hypothetical protein
MTFDLDPAALNRAGRTSVERAATLRAAADSVGFGNTDVADAAARAVLSRRIRRLSSRLNANGTNLQAFVRDADGTDSLVGFSFMLLQARAWR